MFEWDEEKNRSNIRKHGVGFRTAIRIFENAVLSWVDEPVAYGETRYHTIGQIEGIVFLAVIHTDRAGLIRIISARPANRRERKRYDEEIRKRTEP
ncbi:BrnT family toxin [Agrobacterium tumefaciens]|uniref:BrnT family toxin n=1 Tax=Agrobacterium tumefaciens TaxID=358 RepID=UPI001CBADFE1|nr:BrnT family toxin [Agrobacterium tumefaciens]